MSTLICQDCRQPFRPEVRGQCGHCGSDAPPVFTRASRREREAMSTELNELRRAALAHAIKHYAGPNDDTLPVLIEWLDDAETHMHVDRHVSIRGQMERTCICGEADTQTDAPPPSRPAPPTTSSRRRHE